MYRKIVLFKNLVGSLHTPVVKKNAFGQVGILTEAFPLHSNETFRDLNLRE